MKRPRPALPPDDLERSDVLLTTGDVASLLRIHPKHVYRLLRRGMPADRVGGEWRFRSQEVLRWFGARNKAHRGHEPGATGVRVADAPRLGPAPPPLLAANGDVAVERLLMQLNHRGGPVVGFVQSDRDSGLELLRRGEVLASGCHGGEIPKALENRRLAFIHVVDRQVGLALRRG